MIRPFHTQDREALVEIFKMNTPRYFDPQELKDFEVYLASNSDTYLTIEHQDRVVGGTGYEITDNGTVGRITWIFFHPDSAGLGLGRQSVEHCLSIFRNRPAVEKVVVTTSQLAYRFFEKFGLHLVRTEKDYWGQGLDLYLMEMTLK